MLQVLYIKHIYTVVKLIMLLQFDWWVLEKKWFEAILEKKNAYLKNWELHTSSTCFLIKSVQF